MKFTIGKGFSRIAMLVVAMLALVPFAAFADQIVNTIDNTIDSTLETRTITAGDSTSVGFWINPTTGSGDVNGCNVKNTATATVTPTVPTGVTASPTSVIISACGEANAKYVSFSSSTPNSSGYTISVNVTGGQNGSQWDTAPASFKLIVNPAVPFDSTPPSISYVLNPASPDGSNGWYKSDVSLTWSVVENESPSSLSKTGCVNQNITADQSATTYSCSASSNGGSAGPVNVSIKRDATAPSVSLVGGPTDGATYYFGSVPAAPTCSASDATSGLAGDCSVSGYSTAVGSHTVTASATDNAGNNETASATYTVLAWDLKGFYQPVDMNGVLNTVKNGSTVPLKFEVFGASELTETSAVKSFTQAKINCDASAPSDEVEITTTGGTSLRYDTTSGQFVQNWQTPKQAGACYKVTLTTQDGSSLTANFKLK